VQSTGSGICGKALRPVTHRDRQAKWCSTFVIFMTTTLQEMCQTRQVICKKPFGAVFPGWGTKKTGTFMASGFYRSFSKNTHLSELLNNGLRDTVNQRWCCDWTRFESRAESLQTASWKSAQFTVHLSDGYRSRLLGREKCVDLQDNLNLMKINSLPLNRLAILKPIVLKTRFWSLDEAYG